jgi:hypothetical protein
MQQRPQMPVASQVHHALSFVQSFLFIIVVCLYCTHTFLTFTLSSQQLESIMANPENEKTTLQTATQRNNEEAPPPSPTPTKPSSHDDDEPSHPLTSYVSKIITDAAELQPATAPTPKGTPPPRTPNTAILAPKPIGTHMPRVGTVVSPTEVPDKWAPKYLQGEQSAQIKLLIGLAMMFVAVGLFVIGGSLWK